MPCLTEKQFPTLWQAGDSLEAIFTSFLIGHGIPETHMLRGFLTSLNAFSLWEMKPEI